MQVRCCSFGGQRTLQEWVVGIYRGSSGLVGNACHLWPSLLLVSYLLVYFCPQLVPLDNCPYCLVCAHPESPRVMMTGLPKTHSRVHTPRDTEPRGAASNLNAVSKSRKHVYGKLRGRICPTGWKTLPSRFGGTHLQFQHLGCRGRRISVNQRPV